VMVVVAVVPPDVPVMVTVAGPVVAVLLAVSVSTLPPVVGFVPGVAVVGLTVSAMVVAAVVPPDMPVMVTVNEPVVAVLLAVSVNPLLPVVGFVANAAVTPLGSPDAPRVTLPVNPPTSVTVIVSVALLPGVIDRLAADGASVKPAVGLTVSAMVVVAVVLPDVPVMVTVDEPVVAVLLAVSVNPLLPVVGFVANAAVTPLGSPDAPRVTLPVNPLTSVTVIVSVALLPGVTDKLAADGASVKPTAGMVTATVTE